MPVNNFEFEKADGIISSIKGQSVGRDPISAAGIFNFVSIAQKGFGYEPEEEDMIRIVKQFSFENFVLLWDMTAEEAIDIVNSGSKLIVFWDGEGHMPGGMPGIWYFDVVDSISENAITIKVFNNDAGSSMDVTTDADGNLYTYVD